jgi:hypothetical protein
MIMDRCPERRREGTLNPLSKTPPWVRVPPGPPRQRLAMNSDVIRWRKRAKARLISGLGGKCCICGYSKCDAALEIHHIDPSKKDFAFGQIVAKRWDDIVQEARKCVLLCANCHREVHAGLVALSDSRPVWDESFSDSFRSTLPMTGRKRGNKKRNPCAKCGTLTFSQNRFCSRNCYNESRHGGKWETVDIIALREQGLSWKSIGKIVGVTAISAKRKHKKLLGKPNSHSPERET